MTDFNSHSLPPPVDPWDPLPACLPEAAAEDFAASLDEQLAELENAQGWPISQRELPLLIRKALGR